MNDGIREGGLRPFAFAEGRVVALEVATPVYSLPALLRACYVFADRVHSFVAPTETESVLTVALWARNGGDIMPGLIGEFCAELADQELREQLSQETASLRELIVAQAFAEGDFSGEPDDGDYEADPLGIAAHR
jgi:His-Xaa-Ser system protein HxsD